MPTNTKQQFCIKPTGFLVKNLDSKDIGANFNIRSNSCEELISKLIQNFDNQGKPVLKMEITLILCHGL